MIAYLGGCFATRDAFYDWADSKGRVIRATCELGPDGLWRGIALVEP